MSLIAQKLISASGATEETDDDFNLVTSLYHFDGSNGEDNDVFTGVGASGASQSWTRNGNVGQGSFSPFSSEEGKWSVSFDGTDDYLSLPNHSDFTFGSGNWTVEAFVNVNAIDTNYKCIYSASYGVQFYVYNNQLHLAINDTDNTSGYMIASFSLYGQIASAGVWYHVAAYRDGSNFYCSVDGAVTAMGTSSATIATPSAQAPSIGIWGNTSLPMNGYISNLRVIKGTALYGSSNFTAPSSPLTAVTNTKLLTCCSNRFKDKSTSAHTITPSSVPKIQPFSPFAPSAEYDASTMGGSGHFVRTTNDSISFSDSSLAIGSGDFTIEGWYYFDGNYTSSVGLFQQEDGVSAPAIGWWPAYSNGFQIYYGASGTWTGTTNSGIRMFEWIHIAFVRSSGTIKVYVNGVSKAGSISDTTNYTSTNFKIGQYYSTGYGMEGYISNFKMSLNAIYTSNFTPPTALVTPTSGGSSAASTKILVDFTNGKMFDQSATNTASTIGGNVTLSTSVKKFGTSSCNLFGGTGARLAQPPNRVNSSILAFGKFTIEFWLYVTAYHAAYSDIVGVFNGVSAGWLIYQNGNNLEVYINGSTLISGSRPSTGSWNHIALTRDGTSLKMFVAGTQHGSTSTTGLGADQTDHGLVFGGDDTGRNGINGYIDEFRLTLGKARYTSNFTAPTKEFPNL